jgi:hypothetical protein
MWMALAGHWKGKTLQVGMPVEESADGATFKTTLLEVKDGSAKLVADGSWDPEALKAQILANMKANPMMAMAGDKLKITSASRTDHLEITLDVATLRPLALATRTETAIAMEGLPPQNVVEHTRYTFAWK